MHSNKTHTPRLDGVQTFIDVISCDSISWPSKLMYDQALVCAVIIIINHYYRGPRRGAIYTANQVMQGEHSGSKLQSSAASCMPAILFP
jgi:hypothetical protein